MEMNLLLRQPVCSAVQTEFAPMVLIGVTEKNVT